MLDTPPASNSLELIRLAQHSGVQGFRNALGFVGSSFDAACSFPKTDPRDLPKATAIMTRLSPPSTIAHLQPSEHPQALVDSTP